MVKAAVAGVPVLSFQLTDVTSRYVCRVQQLSPRLSLLAGVRIGLISLFQSAGP